MTIGALLVGLALLILIASIVLRPLTQRGRPDETAPREDRSARLEAVLAALRDLDFDHQTGKISEQDHAPARASLLAQAAEAMARASGPPMEDILEERVGEIRRHLDEASPARYCTGCGGRLFPGDRFCPRCGTAQADRRPSGGRVVADEDRYCVECGGRLQTQTTRIP